MRPWCGYDIRIGVVRRIRPPDRAHECISRERSAAAKRVNACCICISRRCCSVILQGRHAPQPDDRTIGVGRVEFGDGGPCGALRGAVLPNRKRCDSENAARLRAGGGRASLDAAQTIRPCRKQREFSPQQVKHGRIDAGNQPQFLDDFDRLIPGRRTADHFKCRRLRSSIKTGAVPIDKIGDAPRSHSGKAGRDAKPRKLVCNRRRRGEIQIQAKRFIFNDDDDLNASVPAAPSRAVQRRPVLAPLVRDAPEAETAASAAF